MASSRDCWTAYDLAYGFRDLPREVDFLLAVTHRLAGRQPASAVELGAGPAAHGRELARRGVAVTALDHDPAALDWLRANAPEIHPIRGDLRQFALPEPVDLAFCPLNTFAYLLTDDDWQAALTAIAAQLAPRGAMVLELDLADADAGAQNWTVTSEAAQVVAVAEPLHRDEATHTWRLSLDYRSPAGEWRGSTDHVQRCVTAEQAVAAVRHTGLYAGLSCWGSWELARRWHGDPTLLLAARRREGRPKAAGPGA